MCTTQVEHDAGSLIDSEIFFFFALSTGPRRSYQLSDARVYEPQIRARLGTTAQPLYKKCLPQDEDDGGSLIDYEIDMMGSDEVTAKLAQVRIHQHLTSVNI